jgi:electron transfer flavoprotein-quinone oxidoreductase
MVVAGDAAGLCLATGLWLEGVNFAIGSGLAAGRAVAAGLAAGDTSARGLAGYRRELESAFVLADHKRLRGAPRLLMSDRVQHRYPGLLCDLAEGIFTVTNPDPKPGLLRLARRSARRHQVRVGGLLRDTLTAARVFR